MIFSESVSSIIEGSYKNGEKTKIVYGLFTTPENAIGGNAICAFQISDVLDTFEGPFKEQETANSNWLPVRDMKVEYILISVYFIKQCKIAGSRPTAWSMFSGLTKAFRVQFKIYSRSQYHG